MVFCICVLNVKLGIARYIDCWIILRSRENFWENGVFSVFVSFRAFTMRAVYISELRIFYLWTQGVVKSRNAFGVGLVGVGRSLFMNTKKARNCWIKFNRNSALLFSVAVQAGIEPATKWLTVTCSTAELLNNNNWNNANLYCFFILSCQYILKIF